MGIETGNIAKFLIGIFLIIVIVVALVMASRAGKGDVHKAGNQTGVIVLASLVLALGVGGAVVTFGTNVVNNVFTATPAAPTAPPAPAGP